MEMKYHTTTMFNNREWSVTPKDNMLVVFPAHIEHSVSESYSDEERFALVIDYWPPEH
jgi:Rps23 Pro-64 3,4-dihydroxylase Tpa1-like proline 4-hydroxylase